MSIYLLLYLIVIFTLLHIWYLVCLKYKKFLHGKYLITGIAAFTIWITLYLIVFSNNFNKETLLILSRFLYLLSLIGGYSIVLFAYFYSPKKTIKKKYKKINIWAIILLSIVSIITLFSPYIIKEMIFDDQLLHHYEDLWALFNIYALLYIFNPLIFIIIARRKIWTLNWVSKMRFKYISIWYLIFILNWIVFLWILPIFDIWVLQKEQVIFFIPFILSIYYAIHRYNFLDPFIWIGRAFIFVNSLLFSALFTHSIYEHYRNKIWSKFEWYWWIEENFWVIHISIWILLFILVYNFLSKRLLVGNTHDNFIEKLERIKEKIPFITNINDLNIFLRNSFNSSFNIWWTHIEILSSKDAKQTEIYHFFQDNIKNKYFLNDVVFIEENKHKFHKNKIKNEVNKNTSLILPIKRSAKDTTAVFKLGYKPLKDVYSIMQIDELEKFARFLTGHLKYVDMYKNIHELNINLDKKVDEKTMEYNNLISKQKEFISVVSHEMRSPITTAIFQADCIIDDLEAGKTEKKYLEKELKDLYLQLVRSSDLVKKLFSVEKYDINKFSLFKEKIDLYDFLKKEIYHFSKNHKKIDFDINIDKNLWTIAVDKVQFRQVIDNLINNAIKFARTDNPKIYFSAEKQKKYISIKIEDNWKWFQDTDISSIFDKYFTGKSSGIWIGIGLYLCKKIIEFHDGKIEAKFSKKLWGWKFVITLPK